MHGRRTGYQRQDRWHCPHAPFEPRVFRTVAMVVVGSALAIVMVQGCRGQLGFSSKELSSPSSGAGSRSVLAAGSFSRNYLSASAPDRTSFWTGPFAGSLESTRPEGKAVAETAGHDLRAPGNAVAGIDDLLDAIALVESNNRANAVGDGGSAVGAYQIRPIFLRDVNRILGWSKYELADRFDPEKSRAMARVYLNNYGARRTLIEMAHQYNGGPRGHLKRATEPFAVKIQAAMSAVQSSAHGGSLGLEQ